MYLRLDIVNKKEYEELNKNYKEIKITIPKDSEELEKDFEYLGLDYKNLNIQDTHIKECAVICEEDPDFSINLTGRLNRLIARADNQGYTTPFNDMKTFYNLINNIKPNDRDKLLAILEAEEEHITNIKDVLKYIKNLDKYHLNEECYSLKEYAESEIHYGDIDKEMLLNYINLEGLGRKLLQYNNAKLTQYGVLYEYTIKIEEQLNEDEEDLEEEEFE